MVLEKRKLRELIKDLAPIKGRHTELVTVYIPADYSLAKLVNQIRTEQSTAQNIKSKGVRKNVVTALEKIAQHLKLFKETPLNGLAIFCGNVSEKEGSDDIRLWSVEPAERIRQKLYWCGQTFILDPLKEMVEERENYGLVVLDKSEATIGMLKGKAIEVLKHMTSIVPGKTKAGGWSQARYERTREGLLEDFLKTVGKLASDKFLGVKDLKGILVGGPGPIKDQFLQGEHLDYRMRQKVLGVVNTSYSGEPGLNELVENGQNLIEGASLIKEKKLLDAFFLGLAKTGLSVYGYRETMFALESGAVEILLISENFDWYKPKLKCDNCKHEYEKEMRRVEFAKETCPKCGGRVFKTGETSISEELEEKAKNIGTAVQFISPESMKGEQFSELGGIGGILRYRLA